MKLYNSLSKKIEEFKPLDGSKVSLYTCGPTVYDYPHIGNLRKYVGDDVLKRMLSANGYSVNHVMNITDVGHLVSDEDSGEDKIEKGARESGRTVWEVAKFYEDNFFEATKLLNIEPPDIVARATEHIKEQIKLIEKLAKQGFTYQTDQAVYFDISKFPDYTNLSGQKLSEKQVGVRGDVVVDKQKKHPQDFALWFFTVGHFSDHTMRWDSPWGEGFPGWHIECSAMSMEYLGDTIDIHTGGIDHIPVHHTNEIAQSEAATGVRFVNYWVHHGWLQVDGEKMSKSKKNFFKLEDIVARGFDPYALRYLFLTAHYRDMLNFTWESLDGAQRTISRIQGEIRAWDGPKGETTQIYQNFLETASNDLAIPQAVVVLHDLLHKDMPTEQKSVDLLAMDEILGLGLAKYLGQKLAVPKNVEELVARRERARTEEKFEESDVLRKEISSLGFDVSDTPDGPKVKKAS